MADRMQFRRDTAANWTAYNPILLEGELGFELDTDQYKLGDGIHNWNDLPYRGLPCVQQRGTSVTTPMSQKAVSDELDAIDLKINNIFVDYAGISNVIPVLDTVNKTFTLPAGAFVASNGRVNSGTSESVTWSRTDSTAYGQAYLVLNVQTLAHRNSNANGKLSLEEKEVVVALVRWSSEVYAANFRQYYINDTLVDFKNTYGKDNQPTKGSSNYVDSGHIFNAPVRFNTFCRIFSDNDYYISLDTTSKTITIPSGMSLFAAGHRINLSEDLVINMDTSIDTTVFVIYDASNNTTRQVSSRDNGIVRLSMTEGVLFHLNWSRGILGAGVYNYYLDNKLVNIVNNGVIEASIKEVYDNYDNLSLVPMATVTGVFPELDTVNRTFTIPAGSLYIFNQFTKTNRSISSIANDLVWTRASMGVEVLILNVSTKETKIVGGTSKLVLGENEIIIAIVRWTDRVLDGNFTAYFLNKKFVNFKDNGLENITQLSNLNYYANNGYFWVGQGKDYQVGDIVDNITYSNNESYKSIKFVADAGSTIYIAGLGGSIRSRLYAIQNHETKEITHIAASGVDTRITPQIITVAVKSNVYLSFTLVDNEDYKSWFGYSGEIEIARISDLETKVIELDDKVSYIGVPCMYNPKVDLKKDNLKILDIGNSYTKDAMHYLPEIINAAGLTSNYSLYRATRGSGSFKTWYNCYHDNDITTYDIIKWAGNDIQNVPTGTGYAAGNGLPFRQALENGGWDIIMIHQVSDYANDYSLWSDTGNGGYLQQLIRVIRKNNPNAVIGSYLVHSYRGTYVKNTEGSSLLRWQNIRNSIKKLMANYGIDFVIPYGTAVQNLRQTSINDADDFTTDSGLHMANGIGDYVASCCYFQSVFAPRFNTTIIGNTWRKTDFDETQEGVKNINDNNANLAQKAAFFAVYNMFELVNPENVDI